MKSIWKYPIQITDVQTVMMRREAQILTVQTQMGIPMLWALVDTGVGLSERTIRIVGTGHTIADDEAETLKYIGTFQIHNGDLVFHVFEVNPI